MEAPRTEPGGDRWTLTSGGGAVVVGGGGGGGGGVREAPSDFSWFGSAVNPTKPGPDDALSRPTLPRATSPACPSFVFAVLNRNVDV